MPDEKKPAAKPAKAKDEPPPEDQPAGDPEPRGEATEAFDPRFGGEEYEARQQTEDE